MAGSGLEAQDGGGERTESECKNSGHTGWAFNGERSELVLDAVGKNVEVKRWAIYPERRLETGDRWCLRWGGGLPTLKEAWGAAEC